MIYEAQVTFHKLEIVKFLRSQDISNFSPEKEYELSISL